MIHVVGEPVGLRYTLVSLSVSLDGGSHGFGQWYEGHPPGAFVENEGYAVVVASTLGLFDGSITKVKH